jgi:hypothetical protein
MKKLLFVLGAAVLIASCKKKSDELPPATQTGANTFAAKVNGNIWTTSGFGPFPANDILSVVRYGSGEIKINARNFSSSPNETEFEILVVGANAPGTYALNTTVPRGTFGSSYAYYVKRRFTPENEWMTNNTHTGAVNITRLDTINRIIAGTFEFQMLNLYNAPQPIVVTEGRFDVKY